MNNLLPKIAKHSTNTLRLGPIIVALLLLSGCNGPSLPTDLPLPAWFPFQGEMQGELQGETSDGIASTAPPPAVSPATEPRLTLLSWPVSAPEEAFLRTHLETFSALHPGSPVELEISADYDRRLLEPAADEPRVDLFLASGFALPTLIAGNLLAPVPEPYIPTAEIVPTLRPGFAVGERWFCLPRDAHTLALAYNPALFDRAETPYPNNNWHWNDLALAAEAVNDEDFFLYALTLNPDLSRIAPFILQAGGDWVDAATGLPTFDTAAVQAGMSYYIDLFASGNAVYDTTLDSTWPGEAFGRGSAGMTIEGSWLLPYLAQEFPRFEFGTTELPAGPGGRATLAFTTCLGVNPNSPERTRAYELAAYLTRPDVAADWRAFGGGMPITPDELEGWQAADPLRVPFVAGLAYARVWQFPLNRQDLPETATPIIRSVIEGQQSVEVLAQRLQAAAEGSN